MKGNIVFSKRNRYFLKGDILMYELNAALVEAIRRTVRHCTNLKLNNGIEYEIYADYRGRFSDSDVIEWCGCDNPRQAFTETLSEWYEDTIFNAEKDVIRTVKRHWSSTKYPYEEHEEFIVNWIIGNTYISLPLDHYLNQEVCVNILLDTGDANFDFGCNSFYPHYDSRVEDGISNESSLLWLAKEQGYNKLQFKRAMFHSDYSGSTFLESCRREILNCTSHMNAVTFLIKMTLDDLFNLLEKKKGGIILSKDSRCGLCDIWSGAGSLFEIELSKDLVVPISKVFRIMPDDSIKAIYGVADDFWTRTLISYNNKEVIKNAS